MPEEGICPGLRWYAGLPGAPGGAVRWRRRISAELLCWQPAHKFRADVIAACRIPLRVLMMRRWCSRARLRRSGGTAAPVRQRAEVRANHN